MYFVSWLHFLTFEMWPFVGDVLCVTAAHSPLVTTAMCSRDVLYCGLHGSFSFGGLTTVGVLVGVAGLQSCWLPGLALCGGFCHV